MNTSTQSQEVIHFGKFKGTALVNLKHSYVRWLLTLENLDDVLGEKLRSLSWVQEEAERGRKFQKRKALAIGLQNSNIPSYERRAYKKRMGWTGA